MNTFKLLTWPTVPRADSSERLDQRVMHVLGAAEVQGQQLGHAVGFIHVAHLFYRVQVSGHDQTELSGGDVAPPE